MPVVLLAWSVSPSDMGMTTTQLGELQASRFRFQGCCCTRNRKMQFVSAVGKRKPDPVRYQWVSFVLICVLWEGAVMTLCMGYVAVKNWNKADHHKKTKLMND